MGLALVIIEIIKVCRYLILPILISLEHSFQGVNISPRYNEDAILLMSYELLCVSFVMLLLTSKQRKECFVKQKKSNVITYIGYFFILFGLYVIFTEPLLRSTLFRFDISFADESSMNRDSEVKISGVSLVFFSIAIVTIFVFWVQLINRWIRIVRLKIILEIIVCFLLISCVWTNRVGSVSRWNMLIGVLLSVYVLIYYNPQYKKKIVICGTASIFLVILVGSLLKVFSFGYSDYTLSNSTEMYFSAQYFDEYFEGVHSVSNCIFVAEKYSSMNIFEGILSDWFNSFPLLMKSLGLMNVSVATKYYHIESGHYDLIMPTVTMGLMRFGWLLAPLYSCISVFFALYFNQKMNAESNILLKLFYIHLVFWFSLFMAVGPNVIEPHIWSPLLAILFLSFERKYIK